MNKREVKMVKQLISDLRHALETERDVKYVTKEMLVDWEARAEVLEWLLEETGNL